MNYSEFLQKQVEFDEVSKPFEKFVRDCFDAKTKGWRGYPSIESIDFYADAVIIHWECDGGMPPLIIPSNLMENFDITGVLQHWEHEEKREQAERQKKYLEETEKNERATFERLKEKFGS